MDKHKEMYGKKCRVWDDDRETYSEGRFDRYVQGGSCFNRSGYRLIGQSELGDAFKNIEFVEE